MLAHVFKGFSVDYYYIKHTTKVNYSTLEYIFILVKKQHLNLVSKLIFIISTVIKKCVRRLQ